MIKQFGSWNAALEAAGLRPNLRTWSRAQIIDAIRTWAERTGTPPTHADWSTRPRPQEPERPTSSTILNCFESWDAALRAAGFESPHKLLSAAEMIVSIRAFAKREGRPPTVRDWRSPPTPDDSRPTAKAVASCFGSWNDGLAAAGFIPHRRNWSDTEIVVALQEFAEHNGKAPRASDWDTASLTKVFPHPSRQTVVDRFGGWRAALQAANLEIPPKPQQKAWSAVAIIEAIKAFLAQEGRPPTALEWKRQAATSSRPSTYDVVKCFGSWNRGIEAAGLGPRRRSWGPEEIVVALRQFTERQGEPPRARDWKHAPSPAELPHPTRDIVVKQFGSWRTALTAAGLA